MRTRFDPRTWLLAGVAVWAAVFAAVSLSGFGGRFELLPDNPALETPLRAARAADPHSAMKPLEAYAEAYEHPLFYPDRKPIKVHVPGQDDAAAAQPLDVTLTSVIMTPTLQMAIVEDPKTKESYRVREGQPIGGSYGSWKLTGLSPRQATFDSGSQGQSTLDLRIFDGRGGEEPTRNGLTPQLVASGALGPPRGPVVANQQVPAEPDDADAPDDTATNTATNNAANHAAAEAAQQAEQIRLRIEQRRMEAQQSQRAASNNKDR